MENKEDNIEDLFRERFENDEVPVSPMVWQNIKLTLPDDKKSFGFIFSPNIILWSIASLLLVSAVIGSYVHFSKKESSPAALYSSEQAFNPAIKSDNKKSAEHYTVHDSLLTNHSTSDHHVSKSCSEDIVYNNTIIKNYTPSAFSTNDLSNKENSPSKKIGAHTNQKSIASAEQKINAREKQKSKTFAQNDRAVTNKKIHAGPTPDLLYKKQAQHSSNKKTALKNNEQNTQSLKSVTETKTQLQNQHTADTNNATKDRLALSVQEAETKRTKKPDKSKLYTAADTTELPYNNIDKTIGLTDYSVSENSSSIHKIESTSILKDSLNKNSISIADTHSTELVHATSSIKNKENTDSVSNHIETKSILADHHIAPSDSSSSTQDSSIGQYLIKDSLSEIPASVSMNQDSSLITSDSLQPAQADSVLAKTTDKKEKEKTKLLSRLSFDLQVTTLLTGATTSTTATDSAYPSAIEDKNRNDKNSLGYSAGLVVNYKITDRLRASAGIAYTNFSEQYHFTYTLKQSDWIFIDTAWQQVEYDSIYKDFKVKDQYSFLSIPLQLSYTFLQKGKLKLSAAVGLRSNILLKGVTYLANNRKDDVQKMTSGFNKISFMYQVALEAEYKWSEHTALLIQPVFLFGATSIHSKASTLQQKPYGMGLTAGLRITF